MSEKQKAFGAGAILTGLFIAILLGISTWVTVRASEVPIVSEKVDTLNNRLTQLNESLEKIDNFIHLHNEDKIEWSVWKNTTNIKLKEYEARIQRNDIDIEGIAILCEHNERQIKYCKSELKENKGEDR